jgi:hypothetical protein
VSTVTGAPIPPDWVPLPELARWLRDMYGLTESEIRDVVVYVRPLPFHFRIPSADEDEILMSWNGWRVDWDVGCARWKEADYPLEVSWDAVRGAVTRMRREQLALPAPAPDPSQNPSLDALSDGRVVVRQDGMGAAPAIAPLPTKRQHNGTNHRDKDAPLVTEMRELIGAKKARSPEDAAREVHGRAAGHGVPSSKIKRLARRYRLAHPNVP